MTPPLTLGTGDVLRATLAQLFTEDYGSTFEVRLSTTTATTAADFSVLLASYTEATLPTIDAPLAASFDLSAYAGQTVYIAFVFSNNDGDVFVVDDVSVAPPPTGPILAATPTSLAFGTAVPVGTASEPQTVTLTNSGAGDLVISSITSSGAPFTVAGITSGITLAAGATTTFTVTFNPTSTTAATGTVSIASNAPGSPLSISLTGTGNADVTSTIPPGTTVGGMTFNRPTTNPAGACVPSGIGTAVAYRTIPFSITTAGVYTITTQYPAGFDGYLLLYQTAFDPAASCTNRFAFSDDAAIGGAPGAQGSQIVAQTLATGSYVIVVTGFDLPDAGAYTGTIVGPGAAAFAVASEGSATDARTFLAAVPNPARASSRVRFATASAQDVTVSVYDVTGRRVATLFQGVVAADQTTEVSLDAASLAPGVYVVRATGSSLSLTQRVTVVR